MDYLKDVYKVSLTRACKVVNISRTVYHYRITKKDDIVVDKLLSMADQRPTEGFWKMYFRIRREGLEWNHNDCTACISY